ncbi:Protein CHROMATIN REMODELING 8 [Yarrowia sp. C11]|nr:Protein CHROMATIN REMODELING 8 [Yarrowia sp. E02]KAG5365188.1 Protein CHROMATIN REMODELING 8 [Yarrowia sp. C11]
MDELSRLSVDVVDQGTLENQITNEADSILKKREFEIDTKRLSKAQDAVKTFLGKVRSMERRINDPATKISEREKLKRDVATLKRTELATAQQDVADITQRLKENDTSGGATKELQASDRQEGESEQAYLVRTGKITPFANSRGFTRGRGDVTQNIDTSKPYSVDVEGEIKEEEEEEEDNEVKEVDETEVKEEDDYENISDSSGYTTDEVDPEDFELVELKTKRKRNEKPETEAIDDGDEWSYQQRLKWWTEKRQKARARAGVIVPAADYAKEEWLLDGPEADAILEGNFKVPGEIFNALFDYQKTCVQWLWELHTQKTGGIIGDEMGLGKTIQIISFLAGLHHSGLLTKPVIVVCPATVMKQWVEEFHKWWPALRVIILHSMGEGSKGKKKRKGEIDSDDEDEVIRPTPSSTKNLAETIDKVFKDGHVVVTTYAGLKSYRSLLLDREWGYCVLDEGHKIRNPDSQITLDCKQLKTVHRLILSGTPIQNNLTELWSLLDFVCPGRLGTLPVFHSQFAVPINVGGYANATNIQVQTAYKCAVVLRDLIAPYLLRRMKTDVATDLPKKEEKVLFCKLTDSQRLHYKGFLKSEELKSILAGKRQSLFGIDILRKICNHPDLASRDILKKTADYYYGDPAKSGKMQVVKALVDLWKKQGHRTLLFCQTRQMLEILEDFFANMPDIKYLRMDGTTAISKRQDMVDSFNNDTSYDLFLLTTRVGGLGVNLTGANRVIIFDPDWNPSTDLQARERSWRLGQKRNVVVYRLMTAGTIEEKIYHRQIFKQFLTNKILKDAKQRRFFKMNDIHDLFSLDDGEGDTTETGLIFSGSEKKIESKKPEKKMKDDDDFYQVVGLNGVSKLEKFETGEEEKEPNDGENDDNILNDIFSQTGVHSALEHDAIMDASRPETVIIEREAKRVAEVAAKALRDSRKKAQSNEIGTVTWTGKFGSAGKFGKKKQPAGKAGAPRFGSDKLSSSSILQNIKAKKSLEESANAYTGLINMSDLDKVKLLEKISESLKHAGAGGLSSKDIANEFALKLTNQEEVAVMRQLLRQAGEWNGATKKWMYKGVEEVEDIDEVVPVDEMGNRV